MVSSNSIDTLNLVAEGEDFVDDELEELLRSCLPS